jgi:F0F1-type ATP synthase assembly protein I
LEVELFFEMVGSGRMIGSMIGWLIESLGGSVTWTDGVKERL